MCSKKLKTWTEKLSHSTTSSWQKCKIAIWKIIWLFHIKWDIHIIQPNNPTSRCENCQPKFVGINSTPTRIPNLGYSKERNFIQHRTAQLWYSMAVKTAYLWGNHGVRQPWGQVALGPGSSSAIQLRSALLCSVWVCFALCSSGLLCSVPLSSGLLLSAPLCSNETSFSLAKGPQS